jgi:Tfp pilus assembly protein PilV
VVIPLRWAGVRHDRRALQSDTQYRVRSKGVALLEVLVAITLLAVAGVGWMSLVHESARAARNAAARDADMQSASATLRHISLWTPSELAAHVGRTRHDGYDVTVSPLAASLWSITVADTLTGATLLATSRYVPESLATRPSDVR